MNHLFFILLTAAVGSCLPLMSSANGLLGKTLGNPLAAVLFAFLVAASIIFVVMLITGSKFPGVESIRQTSFMMWIGGFFIAMNIITFTIGPQKIGISNVIIIFVASQLISALLIEHFGLLHFEVHKINWQRSLGAILLTAGVILIKKY